MNTIVSARISLLLVLLLERFEFRFLHFFSSRVITPSFCIVKMLSFLQFRKFSFLVSQYFIFLSSAIYLWVWSQCVGSIKFESSKSFITPLIWFGTISLTKLLLMHTLECQIGKKGGGSKIFRPIWRISKSKARGWCKGAKMCIWVSDDFTIQTIMDISFWVHFISILNFLNCLKSPKD